MNLLKLKWIIYSKEFKYFVHNELLGFVTWAIGGFSYKWHEIHNDKHTRICRCEMFITWDDVSVDLYVESEQWNTRYIERESCNLPHCVGRCVHHFPHLRKGVCSRHWSQTDRCTRSREGKVCCRKGRARETNCNNSSTGTTTTTKSNSSILTPSVHYQILY